jgi:hypothetical protein
VLYLQYILRAALNVVGNLMIVRRTPQQRAQNQQI